jgi:hypothetical protein
VVHVSTEGGENGNRIGLPFPADGRWKWSDVEKLGVRDVLVERPLRHLERYRDRGAGNLLHDCFVVPSEIRPVVTVSGELTGFEFPVMHEGKSKVVVVELENPGAFSNDKARLWDTLRKLRVEQVRIRE